MIRLSNEDIISCLFINYLVEKIENNVPLKELSDLFSLLEVIFQGETRLKYPDDFYEYQFIHTFTSLSLQDSVDSLIKVLIEKQDNVMFINEVVSLFQKLIKTANEQYISLLLGYRDAKNRDLLMQLLSNLIYFKFDSLQEIAICWIQLIDEKSSNKESRLIFLADHLLRYSIEMYQYICTRLNIELKPSLYIASVLAKRLHLQHETAQLRTDLLNFIDKLDSNTQRYIRPPILRLLKPKRTKTSFLALESHLKNLPEKATIPVQKELNQLKKKYLAFKDEDIIAIVEYINRNEITDADLQLLGALLRISDPERRHEIISIILNKSSQIAAKLITFIFLSNDDSFVLNRFRSVIRKAINSNPLAIYSRIHQIHNQKLVSPADIDELISSREQVNIGHFTLYFIDIVFNKLTMVQREYAAQNLLRLNNMLSINIIKFFLNVLTKQQSIGEDLTQSYQELNFNTRLNIPIKAEQNQYGFLLGQMHSLFGLLRMNPKGKSNPKDQSMSSLQYKLTVHDHNEQVTRAVIPIQSALMADLRIRIHSQFYPFATYEKELYKPVYLSKELSTRLPGLLNNLDFVSQIIHFTNSAYLHQLIDQSILSRKLLTHSEIPFSASALSLAAEPADYDTICCGIGDVDSLALQHASTQFPPTKLVFNLKALLKDKPFIPGQVYIKEHDLMWTSKPDNQEYKETQNIARDHAQFAIGDIPKDLNELIQIGELELQIYRNACGVKFIIGEDKYIVHYLYTQLSTVKDYTPQPAEIKAKHKIKEEVVESNYGQTLFYGDPNLVEQFFVMQFFRHIEKLPKLRGIVYGQLNKMSDQKLIHFFNQIGKILSSGAEFNFQRGMFIPIDAIEEIHYLQNFIPPKDRGSSYGCNGIFSNPENKLISIKLDDIVSAAQNDNMEQLNHFIEVIPNLFKSARLIRFLLANTQPTTQTYHVLANIFDTQFIFKHLSEPKLVTRVEHPNKTDSISAWDCYALQ